MKYQNNFNGDNKLLCNFGKILKEPIINFLKNKITLSLKINTKDINKEIYFLGNDDCCEEKVTFNSHSLIAHTHINDGNEYSN